MKYKTSLIVFILTLSLSPLKSQINKMDDTFQKENDSLRLVIDSLKKKTFPMTIPSFAFKAKENQLWNLFPSDTIILKHTDDEFGEWGGNISLIKVYRKEKGFYAQYIYKEFTFEDIISGNLPKPKTTQSKEYKFLQKDEELFLNSIYELITAKIYHLDIPSHSGKINELTIESSLYKKPSFCIEIYPVEEWHFFHELKNRIINNQ